jgi:hypothetical protein
LEEVETSREEVGTSREEVAISWEEVETPWEEVETPWKEVETSRQEIAISGEEVTTPREEVAICGREIVTRPIPIASTPARGDPSYPTTSNFLPTSTIASMARSRCWRVWAALIWQRRRAAPWGTTGKPKPET